MTPEQESYSVYLTEAFISLSLSFAINESARRNLDLFF